MTPHEFVIWFKGFSSAANNFTLTPKQWDDIKDELNKVEDSNTSLPSVSISARNLDKTYGRSEDSITYTIK